MMTAAIQHFFRVILIATALLAITAPQAAAQGVEAGPAGTEFFVAFPPNDNSARTKFLGLLVTSEMATEIDVIIPNEDGGTTSWHYDVFPGAVTTVELPISLEPRVSEEVSTRAVFVKSRAPVSIFALNARYQSASGFPVLPISHWGRSYIPTALPNAYGDNLSQVTIIAAYDSTWVTITPSTRTFRQDAGRETTVLLERGETYLVQAGPGGVGSSDLSGTEIVSWSRPIGVVSGHVRTSILTDKSVPVNLWSSYQATMILPDSAWGNEYFTVPLRSDREDRYRIMAAHNSTTLTITAMLPGGSSETETVGIDRGEVMDLSTVRGRAIRGAVHWKADAPISVLQLRTSGAYGDPANAPAILPGVAVNHFVSRTSFVAPAEIGGDAFATLSHRLVIITRTPSGSSQQEALAALMLDGVSLDVYSDVESIEPIGVDGYYVIRMRVNSGGHVLIASGDNRFTASVAGDNGSVGRDAYLWNLPFWQTQFGADVVPPYLVIATRDQIEHNVIIATISDNRFPDYFSGLWGVSLTNSDGWEMIGKFTPPNPDVDATVSFRAIADPSGPLFAELRDRDGNSSVVKISDGICSRTASIDTQSITIRASINEFPKSAGVLVAANVCGDEVLVESVKLGTGNANQWLSLSIAGQNPPFVIAPYQSREIELVAASGAPMGTYTTTLIVKVVDGIYTIPVTVVVDPIASVPGPPDQPSPLLLSVAPNPFTGTTTIGIAPEGIHHNIHLEIHDALGRILTRFTPQELASGSMEWTGVDAAGDQLPSGVYYLVAIDGDHRRVTPVVIAR